MKAKRLKVIFNQFGETVSDVHKNIDYTISDNSGIIKIFKNKQRIIYNDYIKIIVNNK